MSRLPMSDEEFERQFVQATKRGERKLQTEPRAERAHYDARTGSSSMIVVSTTMRQIN